MDIVKTKQAFIEDAEYIIRGMRWDMRTRPTPIEKRRFDAAVRYVEIAGALELARLEQKVARRRVQRPHIGCVRLQVVR